MSVLLLKKVSLLLILISASVIATAFAGHQQKYIDESIIEASKGDKEPSKKPCNEESIGIHERMLKVNTKDYGSYDPAPTFRKPPFKLIPN